MKLYMFRTVRLSIVRSLFTVHSAMVYVIQVCRQPRHMFERYLADLRQRIIEAVELITRHMLINTWQELEHRLDISRATTGAHIEV